MPNNGKTNWLYHTLKFFIPALLLVIIFISISYYIFLPELESSNIARKRELIRNEVHSAISVLNYYYRQSQQGKLSELEAKEEAKDAINSIRFGSDHKDYIWINDTNHVMIMHPYVKKLEGVNMMDLEDPSGKKFVREFVAVCKDKGGGYVDYLWQYKDDETNVVPKISYVELFEPWEWIVGTGIYIEDVREEIHNITHKVTSVSAYLIIFSIIIAAFLMHQSVKIERERYAATLRIKVLEEWYRSIIYNTGEGIIVCNADGKIALINERAKKLMQIINEDTTNYPIQSLLKLIEPETEKDIPLPLSEIKQGEILLLDGYLKLNNSNKVFVSLAFSTVSKMDEYDQKIIIALKDNTELKNISLKLKEHKGKLDKIVENRTAELMQANKHLKLMQLAINYAANGIVITDKNGMIVSANESMKKLSGYYPVELIGKNPRILNSGQNDPALFKDLWETILSGNVWHGELLNKRKNGIFYYEEMTITPIKNEEGEVTHFIAIKQDVSNRKISEGYLKRMGAAFEQSKEGILIADMEDRIEFANSAWFELSKSKNKSIEGVTLGSCRSDSVFYDQLINYIEPIKKSGHVITEISYKGDLDEELHAVLNGNLVLDDNFEPVAYLLNIRDITEQKQAEMALLDSESKYRKLYNLSKDAFLLLDGNQIIDCNNSAVDMFKSKTRYELCSHSLLELSSHVQSDGKTAEELGKLKLEEAIKNGQSSCEWIYKRLNGEEFYADLLLNPMKIDGKQMVQAVLRDITETRRLEMELRQAQKLESIGQLAAGIAHEINTPIQFVGDSVFYIEDSFNEIMELINTYDKTLGAIKTKGFNDEIESEIEEAKEDADLEFHMEEAPKAFERIKKGVERVGGIVRAMKEFAHPDSKDMEEFDLNRSIENSVTVVTNEFKYVADLEMDLQPLPNIIGHKGEINQVIINMIINSAHSIKEKIGDSGQKGNIKVSTRQEGEMIVLEINDTGNGIPEEIHTKIYDPFFTTKEVGVGSGQGLAISRNIIVDKHKGALNFETELGVGTTFIIKLPVPNEEKEQNET